MKIKKIFSVLIFCMVVCGSVGAIGFQKNTAYGVKEPYGIMVFPASAWNIPSCFIDLELSSAKNKKCPQGFEKVKSISERCIKEGRILRVTRIFDKWYYEAL